MRPMHFSSKGRPGGEVNQGIRMQWALEGAVIVDKNRSSRFMSSG